MPNERPTISVPVIAADHEVIGELRILRSALPPRPDYHFALCYIALEKHGEEVTKYKLEHLFIVPDLEFVRARQ